MPLDQLCGRHCPPFQEEEHDSGVETQESLKPVSAKSGDLRRLWPQIQSQHRAVLK
jgi:hypothetical protein